MAIVKHRGYQINLLTEQEQTEDICFEALRGFPHNLKHIINRPEHICLYAIKKDKRVIKHLLPFEKTPLVCTTALEIEPLMIAHIEPECLTLQMYEDVLSKDNKILDIININHYRELKLQSILED